jgi:hypothetical protein
MDEAEEMEELVSGVNGISFCVLSKVSYCDDSSHPFVCECLWMHVCLLPRKMMRMAHIGATLFNMREAMTFSKLFILTFAL